MEKITNQQERTTAALAAFLFFLPAFIGKKTEFVTFYMRQSFGFWIVFIVLSILSKIPVLGWVFVVCNFLLILAWFLQIYMAYLGEKFEISFIVKYVQKMIEKIPFLQSFFAPNK